MLTIESNCPCDISEVRGECFERTGMSEYPSVSMKTFFIHYLKFKSQTKTFIIQIGR